MNPVNYSRQTAQYLAAQGMFQTKSMQIYNTEGRGIYMDKLHKGPDETKIYSIALSNKWGRLPQGNKYGVKYTNKIRFIEQSDVPTDRK